VGCELLGFSHSNNSTSSISEWLTALAP